MPNPHAKEAKESSREKFHNITGIRGGGHAHAGESHMKHAGKDGEHKFWDGHKKTHDLHGKTHGKKSRARADKYARGGRAEGGKLEPDEKEGKEWYERLTHKPHEGGSGMSKQDLTNYEDYEGDDYWEKHKRGGRAKRAAGGRVGFADGGRAKRGKKSPENVTININQPPQHGAMPPRMPPPAAPPPGGGGAPPPPPPSAPPGGGGAPPPGGANPMQGLGKGMGFARGGRAKGGHRDTAAHKREGDSNYDLNHWRDYASRNRQEKADGFVQGNTQGIDKVQARARGGRLPDAGALSGVGRLQKIPMQRGRR